MFTRLKVKYHNQDIVIEAHELIALMIGVQGKYSVKALLDNVEKKPVMIPDEESFDKFCSRYFEGKSDHTFSRGDHDIMLFLPKHIAGLTKISNYHFLAEALAKQAGSSKVAGWWVSVGGRSLYLRNNKSERSHFYVSDFGLTADIYDCARRAVLETSWQEKKLHDYPLSKVLEHYVSRFDCEIVVVAALPDVIYEGQYIFYDNNIYTGNSENKPKKIIPKERLTDFQKSYQDLKFDFSRSAELSVMKVVRLTAQDFYNIITLNSGHKQIFHKKLASKAEDISSELAILKNLPLDAYHDVYPSRTPQQLLSLLDSIATDPDAAASQIARLQSELTYILLHLKPMLLEMMRESPTFVRDIQKTYPHNKRLQQGLIKRLAALKLIAKVNKGEAEAFFRPIHAFMDPNSDGATYREFAQIIQAILDRGGRPELLAKLFREIVMGRYHADEEFAFLPNLVSAWFVGEAARNKLTVISSLIILDFLENPSWLEGQPETVKLWYTWRNIFLHPNEGKSTDCVDLYGKKIVSKRAEALPIHYFRGSHPMVHLESRADSDAKLGNKNPLTRVRQKEASLIIHWLSVQLKKHLSEDCTIELIKFDVEDSKTYLPSLPDYSEISRLTKEADKIVAKDGRLILKKQLIDKYIVPLLMARCHTLDNFQDVEVFVAPKIEGKSEDIESHELVVDPLKIDFELISPTAEKGDLYFIFAELIRKRELSWTAPIVPTAAALRSLVASILLHNKKLYFQEVKDALMSMCLSRITDSDLNWVLGVAKIQNNPEKYGCQTTFVLSTTIADKDNKLEDFIPDSVVNAMAYAMLHGDDITHKIGSYADEVVKKIRAKEMQDNANKLFKQCYEIAHKSALEATLPDLAGAHTKLQAAAREIKAILLMQYADAMWFKERIDFLKQASPIAGSRVSEIQARIKQLMEEAKRWGLYYSNLMDREIENAKLYELYCDNARILGEMTSTGALEIKVLANILKANVYYFISTSGRDNQKVLVKMADGRICDFYADRFIQVDGTSKNLYLFYLGDGKFTFGQRLVTSTQKIKFSTESGSDEDDWFMSIIKQPPSANSRAYYGNSLIFSAEHAHTQIMPSVTAEILKPAAESGASSLIAHIPSDSLPFLNVKSAAMNDCSDSEFFSFFYKETGLNYQSVPGDNSCQFRAIAIQLLQIYSESFPEDLSNKFSRGAGDSMDYHSEENLYPRLRQLAVEYIRHAPEGIFPLTEDKDIYCNQMAKSTEWGDHFTLAAMAQVLGMHILTLNQGDYKDGVFISNLAHNVCWPLDEHDVAIDFDKLVVLVYNGHTHYETFKNRPDDARFRTFCEARGLYSEILEAVL